MKPLVIGTSIFVAIFILSTLFFSCAENPAEPSATATPIPQPTATSVPTQAPTSDTTPQATATAQATSTPLATSTPITQALSFTQNFEESNSTHGNYFTDTSATTSSHSTTYQSDGAYSLYTTYAGSAGPGGYVIIHCQEVPPVNILSHASINLWVLDPDASADNYVGIQLVDESSATSQIIYTTTPTLYNTWRELAFPISGFSGVDKSTITQIRIHMQVNGSFYFDFINSN